jgi:putative tryptophan/tyrosine transport system substrate-binding protein
MFLTVTRRELVAALGSTPAWPLAARGQPPTKVPIIGFLVAGTPLSHRQWVAAFVQRLRELGWIEGRTIAIEYRYGEGRSRRFAEIAAEFVGLRVDVIVTSATIPALAAKQATTSIPIVFAAANDPVGTGLVASLARPGGNITGLSLQVIDLAGKRLELLREVRPALRRLAILVDIINPGAVVEMHEVQAMARTFGLEVVTPDVRQPEDIAPALQSLKDRVEALYVVADPLISISRARINALALAARLPTVHGNRELVEAGGLMSYATSFLDLFRRAADYVDKILRGANPGGIPIERPSKFELVINMNTAKALGLDVPPTLLARADDVIE